MINIIFTFLLWRMTKMLCKNIHNLFKLDYVWLRNKMQVFVLKKTKQKHFLWKWQTHINKINKWIVLASKLPLRTI